MYSTFCMDLPNHPDDREKKSKGLIAGEWYRRFAEVMPESYLAKLRAYIDHNRPYRPDAKATRETTQRRKSQKRDRPKGKSRAGTAGTVQGGTLHRVDVTPDYWEPCFLRSVCTTISGGSVTHQRMEYRMKQRFLPSVVFLTIPIICSAEEFPEQPATTTYFREYMTISGGAPGPPFRTTETDPSCNETTGVCRKICGDTPAGKRAGGLLGESISPPDYARFVDFTGGRLEVYNMGNHDRVCRRVKNWGQFTWKVFTVSVAYANTSLAKRVTPANAKMEKNESINAVK
jgi:hypothetical protein